MPSPDLPPALDALAALLDAQPAPVQVAFQYCLALLMVEAGKAEIVATTPGDAGPLVTFRTVANDQFSLPRPDLAPGEEALLLASLRAILDEEGGL